MSLKFHLAITRSDLHQDARTLPIGELTLEHVNKPIDELKFATSIVLLDPTRDGGGQIKVLKQLKDRLMPLRVGSVVSFPVFSELRLAFDHQDGGTN